MATQTIEVRSNLAYAGLLDQHRDAMIRHLVTVDGMPQVNAELMIDQLWARLTNRIVTEHPNIDRPMAERIMNEALGFLSLCAVRDGGYGPSPLVDIGWHTFILYTHEYAAFCAALTGGPLLHHVPTDVVGLHVNTGEVVPDGVCRREGAGASMSLLTLADTVMAMAERGPVDKELWIGGNHSDCGQGTQYECHS